mmetsp:Transcript_58870/g.164449  ORF Transcript_58870/g.164449 Transcript_58870/m.164449 type:complete len:290 (-) Transcript_58870:1060-1929(-)
MSLEHEVHLAAGRHENDLRLFAVSGDHVRTFVETARGRIFGSIQDGYRLAGEHNRRWLVLEAHDVPPHLDTLVRVARAEHMNVRDGAQRAQLLDGLVRRPILANADRVVREDEDGRQMHDGGHPYRRLHVVAEDEEGGTIGAQPAESHAVDDGPHGVLADSEVKVAPGVRAPARAGRHEVTRSLEVQQREAGAGEVRGASEHPRQSLRHLVQAVARRLARRDSLGTRRKGREETIPILWQGALHDVPEPSPLLGILLAVPGGQSLPILAPLAAALGHLRPQVCSNLVGH